MSFKNACNIFDLHPKVFMTLHTYRHTIKKSTAKVLFEYDYRNTDVLGHGAVMSIRLFDQFEILVIYIEKRSTKEASFHLCLTF